ncbi:MAG: hypothetical protein R3D00_18735 [Bacteroidia bacterium]
MKYLPFENLTYKSPLSVDEVRQRLAENIEPKKFFRMRGFLSSKDHQPYEGSIGENSFQINRIIHYRNSFLPQITGEIRPSGSGAVIDVKMKLHVMVWVFIVIWCMVVKTALITILLPFFQEERFSPGILIPVFMLVFVYVLTTAAFKFESSKSKKDMESFFDGKLVEY